ncbi:LytTR family transcriptional regulator [Roseovarius sp. TE539]|uniref:LytTR family DNA-binding domain-containing protein n=1 Tax=Roseovarius sp. TE539 TaxID=2249812 RepID=UPI000DDD46DF|nr:LytTR family DNA-binding domain-containing protein [Roseovarius sp. TE539]RBI76946.1 LytTR family transcriptional regulator [Roseovarius sp. TE539]
MQCALRELHRWRLPLGIWAILSVLAGVAGPFGTFEALAPTARLAYWAGIVGISVSLGLLAVRLSAGLSEWGGIAARSAGSIILALAIHGINAAVFDGWGSWEDLVYMVGLVFLITLMVEAAARLLGPFSAPRPGKAPPERSGGTAEPSPATVFLRRLPSDRRGPLIRIEAQDHYLKVVTAAGHALILMRLADAEAELDGAGGLRVHRSHWIMIRQASGHRRRRGRDLVVMADGAEVPVSRSQRPAARAAGLI